MFIGILSEAWRTQNIVLRFIMWIVDCGLPLAFVWCLVMGLMVMGDDGWMNEGGNIEK